MRTGNVDEAMSSTAKAVYNKFKTGKTGIEGVSDDGPHDVVIVILFLVVFFWIVWAKINHDDDNHRGGNNGRGRDRFGGVPFIFGATLVVQAVVASVEEVASEVAALVAEVLAVAGKVSLNEEILF